MDSLYLLTLFYVMLSFCLIFPIPVFVSCGLTVESIFSTLLGSEQDQFVRYHLRKTSAAVMFHSSLPLGYTLVLLYIDLTIAKSYLWQTLLLGSLGLVTVAGSKVFQWMQDNWALHPIMAKLRPFTEGQSINYLITDIDRSFKSPLKLTIDCNSTSKVIGTENWILKTSSYSLDVAHQSDVTLDVITADEHLISPEGSVGGVQFLNIRVTSGRANVLPFDIRINSSSYKDLEKIITRPINIMANIQVKATLQDRFLTAFKAQVDQNPTVPYGSELDDDCWGCSVKKPNVKLMRTCGDVEGDAPCVMCYCRPMWCVDCIAIWFASRQDQDRPQDWLSSKCTCPLCRATFCVLDVCYLHITPNPS